MTTGAGSGLPSGRFALAATFAADAAFASATPINLVTNGSFESGSISPFVATGGGTFPVSVIVTDGTTGSAFGEAIPSDPLTTGSPDAGGTHAAYFAEDVARQTLTQSIFLAAGTYEIGFDAYDPMNGYNNPFDAMFSGSIAGVTLANYSVKNSPVAMWREFSGLALVSTSGFYDVSFDFIPGGFRAADVVIDRVYVVASDQGGGTPIPEPLTLSLLSAGLVGATFLRRRRNASKS